MGRKSAVPEFVIENHRSIRLDSIRLKHPEIGRPHSKPGWSINEFVGFRFALPNLLDWTVEFKRLTLLARLSGTAQASRGSGNPDQSKKLVTAGFFFDIYL